MNDHEQMQKILLLLNQKKEIISGRMRSIQSAKQKIATMIEKTLHELDHQDPAIVFTEPGRQWLAHQDRVLIKAHEDLQAVQRALDGLKTEMAQMLASEKALESQIHEALENEQARHSEQQDAQRQLLNVVQQINKKAG